VYAHTIQLHVITMQNLHFSFTCSPALQSPVQWIDNFNRIKSYLGITDHPPRPYWSKAAIWYFFSIAGR